MLAGLIALIPGTVSIASGGWGLLLAALGNQWVRLGVACLAVYVYADIHGRTSANAARHEASVRAENAVLARDLAIKAQAVDDATRRAADLDKARQANEDKVHELETALAAKPPAAVCMLDADGLKRLRAIR